MIYEKTIRIPKNQDAQLQYLMREPKSKEEALGATKLPLLSCKFENDYKMIVFLMSTFYNSKKDRSNKPWACATLYNEKNLEVATLNAQMDVYGIWNATTYDDEYTITIEKAES